MQRYSESHESSFRKLLKYDDNRDHDILIHNFQSDCGHPVSARRSSEGPPSAAHDLECIFEG
eukprot:7477181-Alexandrium_andersonii.AAC.1